MFEKDAAEYANRCACLMEDIPIIERAYRNGAEFGYNKAKEEMQEQGLALQSDMDKTIEQNISLKEQIKKMKCCENCRFSVFDSDDLCVVGCNAGKCFNHEKWELLEE